MLVRGAFSIGLVLVLSLLALTPRPLGAQTKAQVQAASKAAAKLKNEGKLQEAVKEYEKALRLTQKVFGQDSTETATVLGKLGGLQHKLGHYAKAESLCQRSLTIREAKLGKDDPAVASALINLAQVYISLAQYARAEPLLQRSLVIREAKLGKDDPLVAQSLNNLATGYWKLGQYARAEPLYQRSLAIREAKFGKDHPLVAASLDHLALVYTAMGQYAKAEPLHQRSLQISEAKLGKDHLQVAQTLNDLALLYAVMGQSAKAEALHQRGLAIREAKLGKNDPAVAQSLNNLAVLYVARGEHAKAETLYKRNLQINEARRGKDHPAVAVCLSNLALVYWDLGQYAKAEPLFQRSLKIYETKLGKDHPSTSLPLNGLAALYVTDGKPKQAAALFERARQASRRHVARVLPVLSECEQLDFLRNKDRAPLVKALSFALQHAGQADLRRRGAEWLLNAKGVAQEALAAAPRAALARSDPKAGPLARELQEVRRQLARLALATPSADQEDDFRQKREELSGRERDLVGRLARLGAAGERDDPWVRLDEVCQHLAADAVFIDVARFRPFDFTAKTGAKRWGPPRYVAWLTFPSQKVAVVDLGPAVAIEESVSALRKELEMASKKIREEGEPEAEKQLQQRLQALAKMMLHPLLKHIGAKQRWVLSPERDLWLVPWSALPLPNGKYAVEKHTISYVTSGRDLLRAGALARPAGPALVLADPDFDLGKEQVSVRTSKLLGKQGPALLPSLSGLKLPGQIGPLAYTFDFASGGDLHVYNSAGQLAGAGRWQQDGLSLTLQTKIARLEGKLQGNIVAGQREMRDPKGKITKDKWQVRLPEEMTQRSLTFVLPVGSVPLLPKVRRLPGTAVEARTVAPQLKQYTGAGPRVRTDAEAVKAVVQAAAGPKVLLLSTHGFFLPAPKEGSPEEKKEPTEYVNPLLRCGLLLAGCNDKQDPAQGVLTGLEVAGLDLRGTELVVLSACETGLGETRLGEGVAGLRQAFQLAGAEAVVATLWQVPDRQSALLVARTFELLAAGQSKAEALRQAQLEVVRSRREANAAAHPFFWAAFTVTGRIDQAPASK